MRGCIRSTRRRQRHGRAVRMAVARKRRRADGRRSRLSAAACPNCGRATIWPAPSCADFPLCWRHIRRVPVAAPVPPHAPIAGRPVYATRLLVRRRFAIRLARGNVWRPPRLYGRGFAFRLQRVRHHLLPYYRQRGAKLYRESIGPLFTPRRVIEALLADDIDVGPLDCYALDLMLRHQPDLATQIRIVATTDPAPIPFLVAGAALSLMRSFWRCRTALLAFGDARHAPA